MNYEIINQRIILWLIKNWIELAGVIFTLIMLYLGVVRKWTVWILGIISSLFYIYINLAKELYVLTGLCFYNFIMSFYGLYCWKFAKSKNNQNLSFCFVTKSLLLKLISAIIIIWIIVFFFYLLVLSRNDLLLLQAVSHLNFIQFIQLIANISILETLITTLSIIISWMTVRKIVESWLLWIISDACTIILYLYKEMYPSAFLYVVYTVFAIFGYIFWKKQAIKEL